MKGTKSILEYDMSYLSIQTIRPDTISVREEDSPFPHYSLYSRGYPCELYEILLRVCITSIECYHGHYRIRLVSKDRRIWMALESTIATHIPSYIRALRKDEHGSYLYLPYNQMSQLALQKRPRHLHLRVKWIFQGNAGSHPLIYIYDG
jgi:hypothetical protein